MKKKNTLLRAAMALFVVATLCACLFAGNTTLAKYTAAATGTADVNIAKWSIKVLKAGEIASADVYEHETPACGGVIDSSGVCTLGCFTAKAYDEGDLLPGEWEEIATGEKVENLKFGLFETVECTAESGGEIHVRPTYIAPGTKGNLNVVDVHNTSDVTADITVVLAFTFDSGAAGQLLKSRIKFFESDGTTAVALAAGDKISVTYRLAPGEKVSDVTAPAGAAASWLWSFLDTKTATNATDDPLGLNAALGIATGYIDDNEIGIAARTNNDLCTVAVAVYAVQVD